MRNHIRGWANENLDKFNGKNKESTIQVPKGDPIRKDTQTVPVRAGSLVIWDSKTPHGTFPNDSNRGRMIQYIKMAPISDKSITYLFDDVRLFPEGFQLTELGAKL